jgi:hypothetical protein
LNSKVRPARKHAPPFLTLSRPSPNQAPPRRPVHPPIPSSPPSFHPQPRPLVPPRQDAVSTSHHTPAHRDHFLSHPISFVSFTIPYLGIYRTLFAGDAADAYPAEIKAEEAALAPKRRSIFRTSGTASTPDLTTLIRAKNNKNPQQQQQSTQQRQQPPSSGKGISSGSYQRQSAQSSPPKALSSSSSDTSSKTSLTSHMSPSATALPGRSRERRHEPSRNEWDPYNSETARQMATIVETVTEPNAPQRVPSTDDSKVRARARKKLFIFFLSARISSSFLTIAS